MTYLADGLSLESYRGERCICDKLFFVYVIRKKDGEIVETSIHDCGFHKSVGVDGRRLTRHLNPEEYRQRELSRWRLMG